MLKFASTKSSSLSRRKRRLHTTKAVELHDEGILFPLKSEYHSVDYALEGIRQSTSPSALDIPSVDDVGDMDHDVDVDANAEYEGAVD